jgi:hypothetical protein
MREALTDLLQDSGSISARDWSRSTESILFDMAFRLLGFKVELPQTI